MHPSTNSSVRQLNVGLAAIPIAWSCPNLQQLTIGAAPEGTRLSPMANSTRNLRSLMCNFLEKKLMEDLLLIVDDLPPTLEELGIIPREDMASIDTIVRLARHPSMRRIHFRAFDDPILSDEHAEQREVATKRLQQAARKARAAMSAKPGVHVTLRSNGLNRSTRFFEFVSEGWKNVPQLKMLEYS
ncbi:hypothetical protein HMN09_00650700 [Mycena chlorophos]|uniref:F-box domain-containing protein n=1 Tax=Mycena chlorophos TaxID=658473 RepID=A0A8H6T3L9_MYCCL|nr:hypothetical protein HMN09_00650700 [Mycena chlorophos]